MEDVAALERRITEAPFQPEAWPSILTDLAGIGGGWSAQLFGIARGEFVVDIVGGYSADLSDELNRRGGADPAVSPRPIAFARSRPMTLACDSDYLTARERDRYPIYREFYERVDGHYCTTALLESRSDLLIGLAVNHSASQGAPDRVRKGKLAALLPALKAAVNLQVRVEEQAGRIAVGALETVDIATFMLDFSGRVLRTSRAADQLLLDGDLVRGSGGKLQASDAESDRHLQAAVWSVAGRRARHLAQAVLLRGRDTGEFRIADVSPTPAGANGFKLGACVLVMIGGARRRRPSQLLLQLGLTEAESSVASSLVGGHSPREIADLRKVSVETVRAQIKTIYAKLGVSRQTELVAKLRDFM